MTVITGISPYHCWNPITGATDIVLVVPEDIRKNKHRGKEFPLSESLRSLKYKMEHTRHGKCAQMRQRINH